MINFERGLVSFVIPILYSNLWLIVIKWWCGVGVCLIYGWYGCYEVKLNFPYYGCEVLLWGECYKDGVAY